MGLILLVVWVVCMILWLVFGAGDLDVKNPRALGGALVPWVCALILGIVLFGGYYPVATTASRY